MNVIDQKLALEKLSIGLPIVFQTDTLPAIGCLPKFSEMIYKIKKRDIKPTRFLPLWDLLGVGLGFGTTLLGKKAAMLCTASVEEVIDKHYQDQINQIQNDEKKLRDKIIKFREDELHHKDIAYEEGASKKGIYSLLDKVIKTGSKIAINISEKY